MTPLSPLWLRFLQHRSRSDRDALILEYWPVADKALCAGWGKRIERDQQHEISLDSLRAAAKIALIDAIDTYDPSKSAPQTHVSNKVRQHIMRELRRLDVLKEVDRERVKKGLMEMPRAAVPLPLSQIAGQDGDEWEPEQPEATVHPEAVALAIRVMLQTVPAEMREAIILHRFERVPLRDIWALKFRQSRRPVYNRPVYAPGAFKRRFYETLKAWEKRWAAAVSASLT